MKTRNFACVLLLAGVAMAAPKVHVIAFGKWLPVQVLAENGADVKPLTVRVRALVVDGRVKEYVLGTPHDVTERLFVVRRAFRVNDGLPEDSSPRWQWQRGGWLLVDRLTGRVSPINLSDFDAYKSAASWYRDYIAYCAVTDDGRKAYAVVAQLGRRKPVLRKALPSGLAEDAASDSLCPAPTWQRNPTRVSFAPPGSEKQTFVIHGTAVDVVEEADEE